jgi:hypothetical protein
MSRPADDLSTEDRSDDEQRGLALLHEAGDAIVLGVAAALEAAFAGDAALCRPVPDLAQLSRAPPLSEAPDFLAWD